MNAKIDDVMAGGVMSTTPGQTIGHVKQVMNEHGIHSMPVTDEQGEPVGIVTASDMLRDVSDGTHVSQVMTRKVLTVPRYADPSLAARIMRNHRIHHVLVTHEKKLVGIVSAFDLLQLVEDHRFSMKNAPTGNKHHKGARSRTEEELSSPD